MRSRTGFSMGGASEADRDASVRATEGCLPTRASRVDVEAVADLALRPLACLLATGGGVTGGAGTSVVARGGEEGGGIDVDASARDGDASARRDSEDSARGLEGGDTIWKSSSSSSSDLISMISGSSLTAEAGARERRDNVGDASSGSSPASSSSNLVASFARLAAFSRSVTARDDETALWLRLRSRACSTALATRRLAALRLVSEGSSVGSTTSAVVLCIDASPLKMDGAGVADALPKKSGFVPSSSSSSTTSCSSDASS